MKITGASLSVIQSSRLGRRKWRVTLLLGGVLSLSCLHRSLAKYPIENRVTAGIFLEPQPSLPIPKGELRPITGSGIQLTKISEGFRSHLYEDGAHYCTIAYGHLVKKAPCDGTEPRDFRRGLSEPAGAKLLDSDMAVARLAVATYVIVKMSDGQYGALCDFVYNVGVGLFKRSTLLRDVNQNRIDDVPIQFRRWNSANGKELPGLKERRDREVALFFEGEAIPKAVPPEGEDVSPIDIRKGE